MNRQICIKRQIKMQTTKNIKKDKTGFYKTTKFWAIIFSKNYMFLAMFTKTTFVIELYTKTHLIIFL